MERYELVEGTSSKFWEVGVAEATLTVRFGRIGTNGQTKDKEFSDAAAAETEKKKLVKEKTGKGYVLVGDVAAPAPAAAKAAPAKPDSAPKPEATPKTAQAPEQVEAEEPAAADVAVAPPSSAPPLEPAPQTAKTSSAPAPVSTIPEPDLSALLARALPTRSRPGAPLDGPASWAEFREVLATLLPKARESQAAAVEFLEARIGETGPKPVAAQRGAIARLMGRKEEPGPAFDAAEADVFASAISLVGIANQPNHWGVKSPGRTAYRACLDAFVRWLVATHGGRMAAETANKLRPTEKDDGYRRMSWSQPVDLAFRAALVKAPEAEYEAAISHLTRIHEAEPDDWRLRSSFAFMLADDRPTRHALQALSTVEAAAEAGDVVGLLHMLPLIADSQPSAVAKWRTNKAYHLYMVYADIEMEEAAANAIAVAHHYGESALPALGWLLNYANDAERTALAETILQTDEDGALGVLLPSLHEKWIRAAIDNRAAAEPGRTFRQCVAAIASGRAEPAIRSRVLDAIHRNGVETARGWVAGSDAKTVNHLEKLISAQAVDFAPEDAWPDVLRDPPWRKKARKKSDDIVLDLKPIPTPFAFTGAGSPVKQGYWYMNRARVLDSMDELPAVIAEFEARPKQSHWKLPEATLPLPTRGDEQALEWLEKRLVEITRAYPYAITGTGWDALFMGIERQPERFSLALWDMTSPALACQYYWIDDLPKILERFGARAAPGLVRMIESSPTILLPRALEVDEAEIAPLAARALLKLKKARAPAIDWLKRHETTAITRLVPDAVGKKGAGRDAAEHALRWYASERGRDRVEAIAADYAKGEPKVTEALAQVLDRDPLDRFPARLPTYPGWFTPSAATRPILKSGGALPDEAIVPLVEMLSFSTPDAVYAGVGIVKEAATRESLAAFSWDLFSAWLTEGAPSKDGWAMRAMGWIGDDDCARQLTRLIRKWPGEAAHARAVTGLDVLVDIGSDVALMNLNGVAEKLKFKGLQDKAREKIAQLAEARDLTPEELADRLAPDLDLDERGGLDIDFGERRFRAGFDEFLKPWVKDMTGQRLKDLPKPNKSDDPEKSSAAVARWGALKKDARAVASLQISRLENMLSSSRRTKPEVFWTFFASHPLIRHLAQRLVWGVYGDADPRTAPSTVFRVSDDLSVTDASDDTLDLDFSDGATGLIGLVHPLQLPAGGFDAWGALFGDYEISQPFAQLGRETYELTDKEKASSDILRFEGVKVEAARLRGMGARGWPLGSPQDAGVIHWLERDVRYLDGKTGTVLLDFGDGLFTGAAEYEDKLQTLGKLSTQHNWYNRQQAGARTFGELDPVTASELLRGPSLLAETGSA